MFHMWRLSNAGEDNLGLACNADGLFLARTPLLERRGDRLVVREKIEIERLLSCAYQADIAADYLMPGLDIVASALNAKDLCLAAIAAVHLRLPDLTNHFVRAEMESVDAVLNSYKRSLTVDCNGGGPVAKASPDDPKHPGWPAGTPGGVGGEFRPKDDAEPTPTQEIKDRISRRELRINLIAALHIGIEALANLIPGVDVAADAAILAEVANTAAEYKKLAIDTNAALDFVRDAPYDLEDLQVSSDYQEFSSYDAFVKSEFGMELTKWFGPAGDGSQYHHIVTQGGANELNVSATQLQNTNNIISLPTLLHEIVSDEYLGPSPDPTKTLYQWLQTQPYDVQREYGLNILRELRILK
jgi:hypothetical protein